MDRLVATDSLTMKTLSPADRLAACAIAVLTVLMMLGVRALFHRPVTGGREVVAVQRPYMP